MTSEQFLHFLYFSLFIHSICAKGIQWPSIWLFHLPHCLRDSFLGANGVAKSVKTSKIPTWCHDVDRIWATFTSIVICTQTTGNHIETQLLIDEPLSVENIEVVVAGNRYVEKVSFKILLTYDLTHEPISTMSWSHDLQQLHENGKGCKLELRYQDLKEERRTI